MLTKVIKYEDFDGNPREETHHFHINKAELTNMEFGVKGGLTGLIKTISETQDIPKVIELIQRFIDLSYGRKSNDGRQFVKKEEYLEEFKSTGAYEVLYMELVSDVDKFAEFVNAVIPTDIALKAKELQKNGGINPDHPALKG